MKKFKCIIPFLLALIMAFAIPLAACDSCNDNGPNDPVDQETKTLLSISVNADGAKTEFVVGDEFSAAGLVVKATLQNSASEENEEVTLSSGDYRVDSSAYNKEKVGTYSIKVSYTYESVTKDASYDVNVVPKLDGIEVALADGVKDTYDLSKEQPTAEIDTTKIVVKDYNGETLSSGYSVKLYRGQDEVALTDGKATVGGGAYAIWVEKESTRYPGYMLSSFVVIFVNDDIVDFRFKSGDKTQQKGADIISDTWVFEAEYTSGTVKEIPSKQCSFELDTMTVVTDKNLTVTYTDHNAKGMAVVKTVQIQYSISAKYGKTVYTYDYEAIDFSEMEGDQTPLKQSDFKGVNSFLKVGSGTLVYRNKSEWGAGENVIEIKNEGLKVSFDGTGTISIGFTSSSASNKSLVGLKDSSGNYVAATGELPATTKEYSTNLYEVTGSAPNVLTFTITKPGTYSIFADASVSGYNRNARIYSIVMEDNVPEPSATSLAAVDADNQTYIIDKKV